MTETYDDSAQKTSDFQDILDFWTFGKKNVPPERDLPTRIFLLRKETKKWAEEAWDSTVHDPLLAAAVIRDAREVFAAAEDGQLLSPNLVEVIRSASVDVEAPAAAPQPAQPAQAPAPRARTATQLAMEAFEDVWAGWQASETYRESKESAASAWRSAAARHDLADIVVGAKYFTSQVAEAGERPMTMRYFLAACPPNSDMAWWQHFAHRAAFALSPREQAEFEALWAVLPDYPNKAAEHRQAAAEWRRRVEPADRLHCLMAARAYAAERAREVGEDPAAAKYTAHFSGFLDRWRAVDPKLVAPEVCDVCGPLVAALGGLGGYNFNQQHQSGVTYLVVNRAMGPAEAVAYRVRQAAKLAKQDLDVPAVVAQVLETTYKSACRRAGVVLP